MYIFMDMYVCDVSCGSRGSVINQPNPSWRLGKNSETIIIFKIYLDFNVDYTRQPLYGGNVCLYRRSPLIDCPPHSRSWLLLGAVRIALLYLRLHTHTHTYIILFYFWSHFNRFAKVLILDWPIDTDRLCELWFFRTYIL